MIIGTVRELYRYPARKEPPVKERKLTLQEGAGIAGDCHADGGERQISLLTAAQKEWMSGQQIRGFCFDKFKENLLIEGDAESLRSGTRLQIADAVLELTSVQKHCYPQLCPLAGEGICRMASGRLFAKVLCSGTAAVGDQIKLAES